MKTQYIIEGISLSEAVLDVNNRSVRQRVIAVGESANKRRYGADVLTKAAPLFEGVQTYANHPSPRELKERPERDVRNLTGWLSGVTFENGGLYATRSFSRTQAGEDAWAIVQDIIEGRAPATLIGGSINALGTGHEELVEGRKVVVVDSIDYVDSVDDVTRPAAGGAFMPLVAADGDAMLQALFASLDYEEWLQTRPEFIERLRREYKAVRQTEAVKAAEADATRLREALAGAQAALKEAESARDTALAVATRKARELMVVEALQAVKIPATWKDDLRNQLVEADPQAWAAIIEREQKKAKSGGVMPRINVSGAGAQTDNGQRSVVESIAPREHEDVEAWKRRIALIQKRQ
jgi:hypothetical protein